MKTSPSTNKGPLGYGTSKAIKAGAQLLGLSLIIYSSGVSSNSTPPRLNLMTGRLDRSLQLTSSFDSMVLISL